MEAEHGDKTLVRRPRSFARFDAKRENTADGWTPVELGGHDVISCLSLRLPAGPEAAGRARRQLDRLRGHMQDSALDVVRLLVTELVTNSVRHARAAGEDAPAVELAIDLFTNAVRVEVADSGPGFEPEHPPRPHDDRPGGWGLCLVDRLSDRWGVERGERTCVWFEVERSANRWEVAAV